MPLLLASLCRLFDASGTLHIVAGRGRQDGLGHAIHFQKGGPPEARSGQRAEDSPAREKATSCGLPRMTLHPRGCRVILSYYIAIMLAGSCSSSSSLVGDRLTHRDKGGTKYKGKIFFFIIHHF